MFERMSSKGLHLDQPYNPAPLRTRFNLENWTRGTPITLIIATENKLKKQLLEKVAKEYCEKNGCSILKSISLPADSGVGEQPYNEAGPQGMVGRARNVLKTLQGIEGTPLVGVIENFIERPIDDNDVRDAYDYGIIGFYNGLTDGWTYAVTKGVKVNRKHLLEAMNAGFDDMEKLHGKVTYGEVLAKHYDVDSSDWHKAVCGKTRFELLADASQKLRVDLVI